MKLRAIHFPVLPAFRFSLILLLMPGCHELLAQAGATKPTRFDTLTIRRAHPRIWADPEKISWLKDKFKGKSTDEVQQHAGPSILGMSLTYLITGDEKWGRMAIDKALGKHVDSGSKFKDLDSKEGRSKTRSIQANLADQAICYDWCYPLLSESERDSFKNAMKADMKRRIEFRRAWRSFHNAMYANAWPVTAGALALYYDDDYAQHAWAFLKPELEDAMKTFDLVFPDGEWAEGFDYNRHSTYHALRIFLAIKTATGYNAIEGSPHMKNTGQYILYSAKPNGLALPSDDNDWPYIGDWEHVALLMLNELYRDGYNQYFINHYAAERFQLEPDKRYAGALWYDSSIAETPVAELPLSRIFRGKGLVISKSNWNWDTPGNKASSTWFTFHCGDYLGDHVHDDINGFSISHKGELAIDAGRYDDDWGVDVDSASDIRLSQFFNYYRRTIAHNTMLVYDPDEKMEMGLLNDGGQMNRLRQSDLGGARNVPEDYDQGNFPSEDGVATCDWATNPGRWETGDITGYKATRDFMYVRGDGTKAYSPDKMQSFIRRVVHLRPGIFVIMDDVRASKAAFKKTWLLHSVEEPSINHQEKFVEINHDEGRLVCVSVLPKNPVIAKVGGPGKECLVDTFQLGYGLNGHFAKTEPHYGEIAGAWRIETSPGQAAERDYFLNVLAVSDRGSKEIPEIDVLSENKRRIVVRIKTSEGAIAVVTFGKGSRGATHLRVTRGEETVVNENMPESVMPEDGRKY